MFKQKTYKVLHSTITSKVIYGLILINVIVLIIETNENVYSRYHIPFYLFELFSISVFTIEYLIRIWTANLNSEVKTIFGSKKTGYILSFYGLIDFIAIIPFFLPLIVSIDLRIFRILRLLRLFRILKLGRYSKSYKTINHVIKETKPQLVITLSVACILLTLSSTLMFYVENDVQPEKFSSISDSMWWAVATLTTVGYGDVYPVTPIGKILSAVIALIGIGFIALPTGILSSAFIENIQKSNNIKNQKCTHCGKKLT